MPPGILERDLLLRIRFELDQYMNLRPVEPVSRACRRSCRRHAEDDVNFVVVRENTEGLYSGAGGFQRKGTPHEVAVQESINTRHGVERIVRYAFELAKRPDRRRKLTLVHKTNVLTFAGDLYSGSSTRSRPSIPDVETDYVHVDAACMYFLEQPDAVRRDRHRQHVRRHHHGPRRDDPGRHGHRRRRQHQPERRLDVRADRRHRAAYTGKGTINPLAAIGATGMLLAQLGEDDAAAAHRRRDPVRAARS